jgi:hypothetical protein
MYDALRVVRNDNLLNPHDVHGEADVNADNRVRRFLHGEDGGMSAMIAESCRQWVTLYPLLIQQM